MLYCVEKAVTWRQSRLTTSRATLQLEPVDDGSRPSASVLARPTAQTHLVEVLPQLVSSEDLGNLDELVIVGHAVEERVAAEDDGPERAPGRPDVEREIVVWRR